MGSSKPPLCRYCRKFLGTTGKNNICSKCWSLESVDLKADAAELTRLQAAWEQRNKSTSCEGDSNGSCG